MLRTLSVLFPPVTKAYLVFPKSENEDGKTEQHLQDWLAIHSPLR